MTLDGQLIDASGAMSGGGRNVKRGAMGTAARPNGGGGAAASEKGDDGGEAEVGVFGCGVCVCMGGRSLRSELGFVYTVK